MSIQIIGSSGAVLDTDSSKQVIITEGIPACEGGGYFTLCGGPASYCDMSLAADVTLAYLYFQGKGRKAAYLSKFELLIGEVSAGVSTSVPGALGLQRFQYLGLYPTSIPIPNRQSVDSIKGHMISAASNAAITMTNAVFGNEVSRTRVPIHISTTGLSFKWIYKPTYPTVLYPYDGLALRTRVAMPSTQTWIYSFIAEWSEK